MKIGRTCSGGREVHIAVAAWRRISLPALTRIYRSPKVPQWPPHPVRPSIPRREPSKTAIQA
jgi:hypothetical protein